MKKLLAFSLLSIALPVSAGVKTDLTGRYTCTGYDPFEKANYTAEFEMTKSGDMYAIRAEDDKKIQYEAIAIADKNDPRSLAVLCWKPEDSNYHGIAIYRAKTNGRLEGTWTLKGQTEIGTETCKKMKV